ncbi:MAG: peptidoglycan-associated lipoprotein Pal [Sulfuricellaceae bacterium]|jgi:peptidoglycan-associated lipoprotein
MKKLMLSVVVLGLLAGCASQGTKDKAVVEERGTGATTAGMEDKGVGMDPLHDPNNILSKRSVYFDFDKYDVKDEYKPLVEAHAKYLSGNKAANVVLQGNADERGSREYNLALGQRRAEAVKKMMNVLGVSDSQMETVSFGEEKPVAECHEESCWSQNRRTDIVYKGE